MIGPWKLCHIIWRLFLAILGAWLLLALLWALLPFPSDEQDNDNGTDYATKVLLGGKTLRRIYSNSIKVIDGSRQGFALDYKLDISNLTLAVSGLEHPLNIFRHTLGEDNGRKDEVDVIARAGDTDGANLPWFPQADAILLFWQIHREYGSVPLTFQWSTQEAEDLQKFDILFGHGDNALLSLKMWGNDTSTIRASVPVRPHSSSPSYTYPVRIAIILALAPLSIAFASLAGLLHSLASWIFTAICFGLLASGVVAACLYCSGKTPHELVDMIGDELQKLRDSQVMRKWRGPDGGEGGSAGNSQEQKTSSTETDVNHVC
ncbi:hypothetical protein TARUN_5637 [Trichoderma arundinaceum]|uniref:Uncharacterized protein n=1 Tax=Trichoderma arundinaceum TaxID=490622 RepID=A0A395NL26_TRIAR|nr:hypothetical protein TARUN_5637 [Trichoderma arundinaceum]